MLLLLAAAASAAQTPIAAERIRADVRTLSSDAFAGRGPGEEGEARTTTFLAERFAALGLEPAGDRGGWFQDVPLVRLDRRPGATAALTIAGRRRSLTLGRDATLALRNVGRSEARDLPMVFAGFGVVDAERGWDPYAGVDLSGKAVVLLANDPDFEGGRDLGFGGRALVVAGRFGSKVEAAARAGAAAVLVLHEEAAASYPFSQLASGDALPAMAPAPLRPSAIKATGWLDRAAWTPLLARAGLDLARLKARARNPAFRAFALPATLSFDGMMNARPFTSRNVVGRLKGASRPDETVLYGAHWDANGTNGPDASGDAIRNGAVDNATGTAELLEVARAFATGPRPARSVLFAAWTAEEKGLLGSDAYAGRADAGLARMALTLNLDPHVALPAVRTLELIGGGRTPMEGELARVAASEGLRLVPEPNPEAGWYFRSDHFSFARRGVPTVAFRAGRGDPASAGARTVAAYNRRCYHQPCDQFDPRWTFAGAAQEATVAYRLGREVAESSAWPGWNPGGEYDGVRAASADERR